MEFALSLDLLVYTSLDLSSLDLLVTPFFFPISFIWNGNVCLMPALSLYFGGTCLVSQVHSWKGTMSQDKLYLKSHSYLI